MTCSGEPRLIAKLQTAAGDQVGRAGVLGHVERVLVAHVDDGRADLDSARSRADGRQQRKRRGKLAREVVDAEVGAVGAELLRRDGEVDRLQERVRRRAGSATAAKASNGRRRESRSSSKPILASMNLPTLERRSGSRIHSLWFNTRVPLSGSTELPEFAAVAPLARSPKSGGRGSAPVRFARR